MATELTDIERDELELDSEGWYTGVADEVIQDLVAETEGDGVKKAFGLDPEEYIIPDASEFTFWKHLPQTSQYNWS